MPDLDGELAELRTCLRETVHQPDLTKVIERSRQRGTRRRMQLGAVAAVLVVGATIPVLRTTLQPVPSDPVVAQATETQTTQPSVVPPPVGPFLYDFDFADAMHGFALRGKCTDERAADCTLDLLVTEDRGDHWESRGLPAELAHPPASQVHRLYVFGPQSLAVGDVNPPGPNRFYSADAGRHWVRVDPIAEQNTAAIPDDALLDHSCTFSTEPNCEPKLVAIEPKSGQALNLKYQPLFKNPRAVSNVPVAGGWWAAGEDPASGRWQLAVSHDGRTWSTTGLPNWPGKTWQVTMTMHNATVYVAAIGELPDVKNGLLAIFRSRDGGNTWEQTFRAGEAGFEPRTLVGCPMATADGQLIVTTEGGSVYSSSDGGSHFQVLPNAGIAGFVTPTRGGYLAGTSIGVSNVYKLSSDGVGWKEITIG